MITLITIPAEEQKRPGICPQPYNLLLISQIIQTTPDY
ncbi:hypothetical protein CLOBOL_03104 [Enterocloster bolteae ATCC BAA-613]|uniref:Uncharacterized protein n=1 Tax=Enterocloster bolteae (strain ATCC BAA-613 / DSM 15670 / CCUG 46953 / JCM 12243 / WAL 16351) TaxID=411902 RepID=A8RRV1_ENTBW|nr:hypothetical protein CLOBOL_03104 [Enterocloster bolteae ATCC BAA-613]